MKSITMGDVTVTRITEWEGTAPITAQLAAEGGREVWERHGSWLAPRFWDRESNEVVTCSASYLIRSAGKNILIDTASGNGKERPYFPLSSHLDTPYIQDLGRAGVKPKDVDIVVCTHLHFDHVGWNTVLETASGFPLLPTPPTCLQAKTSTIGTRSTTQSRWARSSIRTPTRTASPPSTMPGRQCCAAAATPSTRT
jgi:glyoxylase-like metal-dependent hydrolase (beta-lactamase superfamily II)